MPLPELRQAWPMPTAPRPITVIGAGGIVADAHLPAYRKAGLEVAGIHDLDRGKAAAMAERFGIARVLDDLDAVVAQGSTTVFDLATPPGAHLSILERLPEGATVLMQKPMGRDLAEASRILAICRRRRLTAAVNFQLRFSPMMLALRDAVERGLLGRLVDVEAHLNLLTPWHLFPFLANEERVEIAVHSIHYLDLIRSFLGNPRSVLARTMGHPRHGLAQTRTSAILDVGPDIRCTLSINHDHGFGRRFQDAGLRFEGERGAAMIKLGLLLSYPEGEPDELWITDGEGGWSQAPLAGGWFPDAFVGTMANLQRKAAGEDAVLHTSVEDAWHTMALVEACFTSAGMPGVPVPGAPDDVT